MKQRPLIKGERFGRLTILGEFKKIGGLYHEKCLCDCGNIKYISRTHIRVGNIKSCGCLSREIGVQNLNRATWKHGLYGTKIYKIFQGIKRRCKYPETGNYYLYGGRGIKCEWEKFEDFYKDMGESYEAHVKEYGERDTSIDRIDNDKNYCKENCRWATRKEQWNNRRSNKIVFYKGKRYTQQELCDYMGVPNYVFARRLKLGWGVDDAIEKPFRRM